MPKYSVNEVLDIIKNLTNEEKLELQNLLPNILDRTYALATKIKALRLLLYETLREPFGRNDENTLFLRKSY